MGKIGKKSKKADTKMFTACPPFPKQPYIYISDPTDRQTHVNKLDGMLDITCLQYVRDDFYCGGGITTDDIMLSRLANLHKIPGSSKKSLVINDMVNRLDGENQGKIQVATKIREYAAEAGRTFASINLYMSEGTPSGDLKKWGPNHLELGVADLTVQQVADKVYKWLFTAIPPSEHILLHTKANLQAKHQEDQKQYPDYEYCGLAEIKNQPKDKKIQFGVVITSKPVVVPNTQRLHWTVADKTGTGNFYFQYRGPTSQSTWDWVLSLQPGDIKSLPRMPCIEIREPRRVRIAKLPLRTTSFAISAVGLTLKGLGHGLVKLGDIMTLGKSSEFVPADDVDSKTGKKIHWGKKFAREEEEREERVQKATKKITEERKAAEAKVLEEKVKGMESDSDEYTLRGSDCCEKDGLLEKEFV